MEKSVYSTREIVSTIRMNAVLVLVVTILVFAIGFLLIEPSVPKVTCATVGSLQEAKKLLPTHPWLDGNDKDEKPCEERYPNQ